MSESAAVSLQSVVDIGRTQVLSQPTEVYTSIFWGAARSGGNRSMLGRHILLTEKKSTGALK